MNKPVNPSLHIGVGATTFSLDEAPEGHSLIQLLPAGAFSAKDGRGPFSTGDMKSMEEIVARTKAHLGNSQMMIDYDHQSVFGAIKGVGGNAKAAGWVKELMVMHDGIWARVEWTAAAKKMIDEKEYRYISPYFKAGGGKVLFLQNGALLNTPALDLAAVAARLNSTNESEDMEMIAKALGLSDGVSEAVIVAAIESRNTSLANIAVAAGLKTDAEANDVVTSIKAAVDGQGKVAEACGLKPGAKSEDVVAAIAAVGTSENKPGESVPMSMFTGVRDELAALKETVINDKVEVAVAAAMEAAKITPAQKDWATKYATDDFEAFAEFIDASPVLVGEQLGDQDNVTTDLDANDLADEAMAYQREQKAAGNVITMITAVQHVEKKGAGS